ncbi:MAG: hypothetical protein H6625_02665 [Bdellovibrionaceae bacterium]|nr:hypothetical protein [Pseudobdellovibrionaceae bacterium]
MRALQNLILEKPDKFYVTSIAQLPVESANSLEDKSKITQSMIAMSVALAKKDTSIIDKSKPVNEQHLKTEATHFSKAKSDKGNEIEIGVSMDVENNLKSKEFDKYKKKFRK